MTGADLPVIVIPCFDEERRLDRPALAALADSGRVRLLLVDDGSTDGTLAILHELRDASSAVDVLELAENQGKAEAVRLGLLRAAESGATVAGYYDADLATPPAELLRLIEFLEERPGLAFVLGSRVRLLGRTITRSPVRHYLGRVFATFASLALAIPVYDTQCGAKVFRVTPELVEALDRPFRSAWVLDVELMGRLLSGSATAGPVPVAAFEEVPLLEYRDAPGSKVRLREKARALADLIVIGGELQIPRWVRRLRNG